MTQHAETFFRRPDFPFFAMLDEGLCNLIETLAHDDLLI